jgi:hypothetical protein
MPAEVVSAAAVASPSTDAAAAVQAPRTPEPRRVAKLSTSSSSSSSSLASSFSAGSAESASYVGMDEPMLVETVLAHDFSASSASGDDLAPLGHSRLPVFESIAAEEEEVEKEPRGK